MAKKTDEAGVPTAMNAVPTAREPETAAGAGPREGLTSAEAAGRLERFGPNAVTEPPPRTWRMLAGRFWGIIPWMLEAAVIIDLILAGGKRRS
jgi:H+-transporting ATPase